MVSKNLYNFYHIYADGQWQSSVAEYVSALLNSGLYDNLAGLFIGIAGSKANQDAVITYLSGCKLAFKVVATAETGWEQVTQIPLAHFAKTTEGYVLYAHSKGSSDPSPINIAWRQSMICCNVVNWREMVAKLEVVQAAGSHWLHPSRYSNVTTPFFGGTFWWARLDYVRTLGEPKVENRWQAESWIGEKNPIVFDNNPGWPGFSIFVRC